VSTLTVAYLGPAHTYSYLAAKQLQGRVDLLKSCDTIDQVFGAIETGQAGCGVVPLYNTSSGLVSDSALAILRRLLARTSGDWANRPPEPTQPLAQLCISDSFWLPIQHCLVSWGDLKSIRLVSSKQQALEQCRAWLAKHLPTATRVATDSSAAALPDLADHPDHAAIVSRPAADSLEAPLLLPAIQDQTGNATEFVVVQKDHETKPLTRRWGAWSGPLATLGIPASDAIAAWAQGTARQPAGGSCRESAPDQPPEFEAHYEYWLAESASDGPAGDPPLGPTGCWSGKLVWGRRQYWVDKRSTPQPLDAHEPWTAERSLGHPPRRAWRLGASSWSLERAAPEGLGR
jgi:prephenate dehydratase